MQTPSNPRKTSSILTLLLMAAVAAVFITISMYVPGDADGQVENMEEDLIREKLVGRWEQAVKDSHLDMDLRVDGSCTYNLRNSDRLNIRGTWTLQQGRLILHIESVNGGTTFRVGEDVTLGPILKVDSRTLMLGSEEDKRIFKRQR